MMYGNNVFIYYGFTHTIAYSTNALNWKPIKTPCYQNGLGAFGNGTFVIVGTNFDNTICSCISYDGVNWVQGYLPNIEDYTALVYGN